MRNKMRLDSSSTRKPINKGPQMRKPSSLLLRRPRPRRRLGQI